jgi:hypothetical protein
MAIVVRIGDHCQQVRTPRMGRRLGSVRLWQCRDDYELGDPPLLEYRRMGGMFRKVG